MTLRVEYVPTSLLAAWPGNPKTHAVEAIVASMRRFGFTAPLLLDATTGRLVAGHGRLEALEALRAAREPPPARVRVGADGEWEVPVLAVPFASAREAGAYVVADNRLGEAGGWDPEALATALRALGDELAGVGFNAADLARLEGELAEKAAGPEAKVVSFKARTEPKVCPHCGAEL